MKPYPAKYFENLKQSLQKKEEFLPFDFLGRSLAYNPYTPRAQATSFQRAKDSTTAGKIIFCEPFAYEGLLALSTSNTQAVVIDFTAIYGREVPSVAAFDCITQLRRYSERLIIHSDIFISPYQLLESVIYGSDCVILEAGVLGEELASMCAFASRVGLVPIVKITTAHELKAAIFAKAEVIYIARDFDDLLKLVPNSKIIFRDMPLGCDGDTKSSYGVDMFLVRDGAIQ
ncbi:hypothetical protein BKH46_03240 [Helicobacter sp. 12S02634-8]|uniref:hypothetical protein n=1 Tax=Helicobacter sp. 12S02634-8 TaxID=1476199 RepID=UPI000BA52CF3|nr:hypothetical protein [Helicobacter sp. 12S02634-8]PAF47858.1 hypothetical protein BKH46_03240 [Helicobacter sp. 12S02634-8]